MRVGVTFVVSSFAWWINSCNYVRIVIGTWFGGGGGWVWIPFDIRITYEHVLMSIGINLEYLTPHDFLVRSSCLIVFPEWWGCAASI